MKRIKSIWMRLLVIVISVAMMLGCFGGTVFAAEGDIEAAKNDAVLHASETIKSKVALTENFTIPQAKDGVKVTVKNPAGKDITEANTWTYRAINLGNYTVTYTDEKSGVSYTYNINCYQDSEYFIYVKHNGATIPTYIKTKGEFTLPEWYLAQYDEDGNVVKVEDKFTAEWKLDEISMDEKAGETVKIENSGSHIITLSARLKDSNGEDISNKLYSKDFAIIAQDNFEDKTPPTLRNIANMPSSASLNTKVTLPKATASDDYDENVRIEVTVKDPDNQKVKNVEVNEDGYAVKELETEVDFDNDKVISFYPTKEGPYTVEYIAYDDFSGKPSSLHTYTINVSDRTGPIIKSVKDDTIPTVWGLKSVVNAKGETKDENSEDFIIKLPIPEVVDNVDAFNLDEGDKPWTGNIKMTVEIKNPSVTVARFDSLTPEKINNENKGVAVDATNSTYGKYFKKDAAGVKIVVNEGGAPYIRLNFADFIDEDDSENDKVKAAVTGIWTVTFSFRDANNNGGYNDSQKVYTIDVTDTLFRDDKAPEIEAPTLPEYLILGNENETYTVPYIVVSDNKDSRLTEVYQLECNGKTLDVEGGEELQIVKRNDGYHLINEDGDVAKDEGILLTHGADLKFVFTAKDDAGNESELKLTKDGEKVDYSLKIYIAEGGFKADEVHVDIIDTDKDNKEEQILAGTSEPVVIGGFRVDNITQREFVGYELTIKDEDGNSLSDVTAYTFFAKDGEDNDSLYVKNISFNPAKSGVYEVSIRVLDAMGNSYVYGKKIYARKDADLTNGPNNVAAAWDREATARKTYSLQRKSYKVENNEDAAEYISVFKINGGKFSLLGYDFTPFDQGSYTITEFYGKQSDLISEEDTFNVEKIESKLTRNAIYGMTVKDESTTNFEIDGFIPTYMEKTNAPKDPNKYEEKAYYITAPIVAYSENVNYDVTVSYTTPDGNNTTKDAVKVYEKGDNEDYTFDENAEGYEFRGRFALRLELDGTYTMTITANGESKTYSIKVGDIEAPQFTLIDPGLSMSVGDKFKYGKIENIEMGKDESESDITVIYKLFDTSNSEVSSVSGSMTLKDYNANNEIKLTESYEFQKSGEYRVEITLRDKVGNKSVQKYTIAVSTATKNTPASLTMLSTILIIVGVLLILGVIVYLIRFRKRRA